MDDAPSGKSRDDHERRALVQVGRYLLLKTLEWAWTSESQQLCRKYAPELRRLLEGRSRILLCGSRAGCDFDVAVYELIERHHVGGLYVLATGEAFPVLLSPISVRSHKKLGKLQSRWNPDPNLLGHSSFADHWEWLLKRLDGVAFGEIHVGSYDCGPTVKKALQRLDKKVAPALTARRAHARRRRRRSLPKQDWPTRMV